MGSEGGPFGTAERSNLEETLRQGDPEQEASRQLSQTPLETPGAIPGYEMLSALGEGSFGTVWLARERKTGKQVAIKFYTQRRGLDWSLLTREVEKLGVLYTSRNIVGLLDVGWDHDPPYFVMEYLDHGSLAAKLAGGPLPVDEALRLTTAIGRALVHAHGSGILHCDLKPANVLLDGRDEPRLGDFGQSRLTTEHSPTLGTMYYMPPDQADLHAVPDARWDVYALGALLYHMLTGAPPYERGSRGQLVDGDLETRLANYRQLIAVSPRPDDHRKVAKVDPALAAIIDGCLQPDPEQRIPNIQAVLNRLEERELKQARRPLVALGFLGPVLFLVAVYWIAQTAVPKAIATAEQNALDRALSGDAVSALFLADGLGRDLAGRLEDLEDLAQREELREVVESSDGLSVDELVALIDGDSDLAAAESFEKLVDWRGESDRRLEERRRTADESWFVQNATGRQVFRMPARKEDGTPEVSLGRDYHWRRYFHGGADDSDPAEPAEIRRASGITSAFRSQVTGQYMVALAVPIWDADHENVIGVLARTIHISELLRQWEHTIRESGDDAPRPDRFLVLADVRGTGDSPQATLLDHPWMTSDRLQDVAPSDQELDALVSQLRLNDRTTGELADLVEGHRRDYRDSKYADPIALRDSAYGGDWLAAFAPVEATTWVACVQERRSSVLAPVEEVQGVFIRAGYVAVVVFVLLLAALWFLLNRASLL